MTLTIAYFSTPVKTIPCIKTRWARKKITTGITKVMRAPVWIRFGWRPYRALNFCKPTERGHNSGLATRYTNGAKKSFQAKKK